ncbi:hypothetical protein ScalyP_jg2568 [Parmales sp. scaly parma]|nr:hypothetical protein ScalyP_jg2568 [Parmales sp. scaly parma]
MVYLFKSSCGLHTIYMGKNQVENDRLINCGFDEDVWFHVDTLSSAHVYIRLLEGQSINDLSEELLLQCSTLVKANSIEGCKRPKVTVIFTSWSNLKKTKGMAAGEVSYHDPAGVMSIEVEKNNAITNALNKTKKEILSIDIDLEELQRQNQLKNERLLAQKNKSTQKQLQVARELAERIEREKQHTQNFNGLCEVNDQIRGPTIATVDTSAAEEFEDDWM